LTTTTATSTFLFEVTPLVTATSSATVTPPPSATASPTATPAATPDRVSTTFPQTLAGKIAFYSDRLGQDRAFVMDPDGGNVTLLPDTWVYDVALAAQMTSHDGRTLAQAGWEGNLSDIFLVGVTGTQVRRITWMAGGRTQDPAWSPDDARIAFASSQDGDDEVFIVLSAGSPVRQLTYNQLRSDVHPTWSPDGSRLAYESSGADGRPQVWTIAFDGTDHRNISNNRHRDWSPVWIPDATGVLLPTPTPMPVPTRRFVPSPVPTPTAPQVETRITGVNRTTIRTGLQYDDFEVWGSGFQSGVRVFLRQAGGPDIFAHDVSVVDAGLITCKFDLRELRIPYTQEWVLRVENPDGGSDQRVVWLTPSSESDTQPPGPPEH
jgi:dipeptidyl aminopeptidase/acylaminoacyl peptidase